VGEKIKERRLRATNAVVNAVYTQGTDPPKDLPPI
jgi:hypothetical protein